MDEPLSNLDAKLRVEMRIELKRLHSEIKQTILYVTHDQVETLSLGTHLVVMNEGRLRQTERTILALETEVDVSFQPGRLFLFDEKTGQRMVKTDICFIKN